MQYYKIISTGEIYALDPTTNTATQVDSIPSGGQTLSWAGAGLPPSLQGAEIKKSKEQEMQNVQVGGTPYFMGDQSLVKFQGNDITWLVDNKSKTMRPFVNQQALQKAYGPNLQQAIDSTVTLHSGDMGPGGVLNGYQLLDSKHAIQTDGTYRQLDASNSQLQSRYGKSIDVESEKSSTTALGGFLSALQKENSGIDSSFVDTIKSDPNTLAFYINGLSYGGYTLSDVYRDIKKKELVSQGAITSESVQPISASEVKSAYQNTDAGRSASTDPKIAPPQQIGGVDPRALNSSVYNIPADAYKTLVPQMDPNSPEFKALMDGVNTAYIDILTQQINANTESEKAIADQAWRQFKADTERTLGITLSNNSIDAWKQIENAKESFSSRGLSGSGIESQNIDEYLRGVRRNDEINRTTSLTAEEKQKSDYYSKFATPDQIAALTPEERQKYGLEPSAEIRNALSFQTLKEKYPEMSDSEINTYISSILDTSGNYRSALYSKKISDIQKNEDVKKTYQQSMVENDLLNKENKAYEEFSKSENPFLRSKQPTGSEQPYVSESNTNPISTKEQINKPTEEVIQYAGGLAPDDTKNMYNTETGRLNPNYKAPVTTPSSTQSVKQTPFIGPKVTEIQQPTVDNIPQWKNTLNSVIAKQNTPVSFGTATDNMSKASGTKQLKQPQSITGYDWNKIGGNAFSGIKNLFK